MKKFLIAFNMISLAFALTAFAHEGGSPQDTYKTGLFGTVQVGSILINSDDPFITGMNNKQINGYSDQKEENAFRPVLSFQLNYKTQEGTTYYFGSPAEEIEPRLNLGVAHTFADNSILDISVDSQLLGTTWKDPYMTGVAREDTSISRYGARLKYDRILGTGFKFQYHYLRQDVDEDTIGDRLPDLRRDGDIHRVDIGSGFRFGQKQALSPSFFYTRAEMKGESNSYDGFGSKLQYRTNMDNLSLSLNLSVEKKDYQKIDPIFMEKQEDKNLAAMAMLTWMNPFGYEKIFANLGTGFRRQYSNIEFYDSRTTFGFVKTGYNF